MRIRRLAADCSSQHVRFGFIEPGTLWTLSFLSDRLQVGLKWHAEPGHLKFRSNFLQLSEMVTVGKVQGRGKFLLTFCLIYALLDVRFTIVDSLLFVYRAQLFARRVFMENKLFFPPSYATFWRQFSSWRSLLAEAKLSFGRNGKVLDVLGLISCGLLCDILGCCLWTVMFVLKETLRKVHAHIWTLCERELSGRQER